MAQATGIRRDGIGGVGPNRWQALEERLAFNGKEKKRIYRKLGTMLRNGVRLPVALEFIERQATKNGKQPNAPIARIVRRWRRAVQNGTPLGDAMRANVPHEDALLIRAGEASGRLAYAFDDALALADARKKIIGAIVGNLAYPIMLILMAIGFLVFFRISLVPTFEEVMPRAAWFGPAATMTDVADFIVGNGLYIVGALVVLGILVSWSFANWTGPLRVKFDRFVPWSIYRIVSGVGFMLAVSGLVRAGMKMPDIIRLMQQNASPWLAERLRAVSHWINNGRNFGEALVLSRHGFPDEELALDLVLYASMDEFEDLLIKISYEWLEEAIASIKASMQVIFNVSLVSVGLAIGAIAMAVLSFRDIIQASSGL